MASHFKTLVEFVEQSGYDVSKLKQPSNLLADLDHLDALWAADALNEDDFLNALPWEAISKVLRAASNVAMRNPDHGEWCVYSGGGPCDCGLPELRHALDELGK